MNSIQFKHLFNNHNNNNNNNNKKQQEIKCFEYSMICSVFAWYFSLSLCVCVFESLNKQTKPRCNQTKKCVEAHIHEYYCLALHSECHTHIV